MGITPTLIQRIMINMATNGNSTSFNSIYWQLDTTTITGDTGLWPQSYSFDKIYKLKKEKERARRFKNLIRLHEI